MSGAQHNALCYLRMPGSVLVFIKEIIARGTKNCDVIGVLIYIQQYNALLLILILSGFDLF